MDVALPREFEVDHRLALRDDAVVRAGAEFQRGHVFVGGDKDVDRIGLALAQVPVKLIPGAGVLAVGGLVGVGEDVVDGGNPG